MLKVFKRPASDDCNFRLQIKTELPLDKAVKWLCVYMVGILGAFLLIMMTLLNGKKTNVIFFRTEKKKTIHYVFYNYNNNIFCIFKVVETINVRYFNMVEYTF